MRRNNLIVGGLILWFMVGYASADVVFGSHIAPASINVNLSVNVSAVGFASETQAEVQITWLRQVYQVVEDVALWFMRDTDQSQMIMDDNRTFSNPEINKHTWITEYNYDEYLPPGNYYWKARSMRNGKWGMWSDTRLIEYTSGSIYFDWTVI